MDPVKNFAKVNISGYYDGSATEITLVAGEGLKLPDPSTEGEYNLVWWNSTDYNDPSDDILVEIVRVTAKVDDILTVTRAQEDTGASTKNISGRTYIMILAVTKKTMDDLEDAMLIENTAGVVTFKTDKTTFNFGTAELIATMATFTAMTAMTMTYINNDYELTSLASGTANQMLGVNSTTNGYEYKSILGTSDQVIVTHAANSITFSTPQSINTTSSPTFANITDSGLTASRVVVSGVAGILASASTTTTQVNYLSGATGTTGTTTTNIVFSTSPSITTPTITTSINPSSNDGATLGASGTAFSDLFLADGGVINWNAGNATITHSTGILTFNVFPVTPSGAPDADYEVANKKYVDDSVLTENLWDRTGTVLSPHTSGDTVTIEDINLTGLSGSIITSTSVETGIEELDARLYNNSQIEKDSTGFVEGCIITSNGDRTVTLTGTVEAYWRGARITALISGWTSPAHGIDTSKVYYLYSTSNIAPTWSETLWDFSYLQVALAFYDATLGWVYQRECHGFIPHDSHEQDHYNIGAWRQSGGDLSGYTLSSTTAAERRPLVSGMVHHDEDLETTQAAISTESYTRAYLTSTGISTFLSAQADIVPLSTANPYYNSFSTPNWVQTLMPANSVMSIWLVSIPMCAGTDCQKLRFVWGQGQWITQSTGAGAPQLAIALAAELQRNFSEMNLGTLSALTPEFLPIARITITYVGGNWYISSVSNLTGSRYQQTQSPAGTFLSTVTTDATITGDGTVATPLSVAYSPALSIVGQTGLLSFTGITSTNRIKTVRDAADTILELGGSYTPTGTWTSLKLNENVALTTTSTKLNYLTGATGTTGTNTTNIVYSTSPTITTPIFNTSITTNYLTAGSVLFAGATANITQDNTGFSFDDSTNTLTINRSLASLITPLKLTNTQFSSSFDAGAELYIGDDTLATRYASYRLQGNGVSAFNLQIINGESTAGGDDGIEFYTNGDVTNYKIRISEAGLFGINMNPTSIFQTTSGTSATRAWESYYYANSASSGYIAGYKARGTITTPLTIASGDFLMGIYGNGYGATAFASSLPVGMIYKATENFTDSAHGTSIAFEVTQVGSAGSARQERFSIGGTGDVTRPGVTTTGTEATAYTATSASLPYPNGVQNVIRNDSQTTGAFAGIILNTFRTSSATNHFNYFGAISTTTGTGLGGDFVWGHRTGTATSAEMMRLLEEGNLLIGHSANIDSAFSSTDPRLLIANSATNTVLNILSYSTTDNQSGIINLGKSSSSTIGTEAVTASGEDLGRISFSGVNSTPAIVLAGYISCQQDGAAGASYIPGRLMFFTASDAAATTEKMRLTSTGVLLVGTTTTTKNVVLQEKLAIVTVGSGNIGGATFTDYIGTTADRSPVLQFQRSRGTTDETMTVVVSGDRLGDLRFRGADGTNFIDAARIHAIVDGTPGTNDMPGALIFSTTADGASSTTERMRITSTGNVGIGTTSPSGKINIVLSQTDNAASSTATIADSFLHLGGGEYASGRYYLTTYGYSTGQTNPSAYIGGLGTLSTGYGKTALVFGTRDVATDTLPTERMRIDTNGNVGIGTTPSYLFHVNDTSAQSTTGYFVKAHSVAATNIGNLAVDTSASHTSGTKGAMEGVTTTMRATGNGGTTTSVFGFYTSGVVSAGSTISNLYGYYVASPTNSGTITNQYGLFIAGQTAATVNYGIYLINSQYNTFNNLARDGVLYLNEGSDTASQYYAISFLRQHSNTGANVATINTEMLGAIHFRGNSGAASTYGAGMYAQQVGTAGTTTPTALYFQTADGTNAMATRLYISPTGATSIGANTDTTISLYITKAATGGVTTKGVYVSGVIQADSTTSYTGFNSAPSTVASAFTTTALYHYFATGVTIGAGSAVTCQYGYMVSLSMTTGSKNYGFYGNLASATDVWNLYMNGNADNYIAGKLSIGTTSSALGKLKVTQANGEFSIIAGADVAADSITTATRKFIRFGMPHYTNTEEPMILLVGDSDGTNNIVSIGGGTAAGNAATYIKFLTGATHTTTTGTGIARFTPSGNFLVGSTDDDGTPATGRIVSQGSTNDGSTRVFVGRDSDGANVFNINTNGDTTIMNCTMSYNSTTSTLDFTFV